MSERDPRPAAGSAAEPDTTTATATAAADDLDAGERERAAAARLLLDVLQAQHRALGSPETSARERAMTRRVLGEALDLGVLTRDDLDWATEHLADVVVVRPRRGSRPGFVPMGLRCALLVEAESGMVGLVRGASREEDQVVFVPAGDYVVERPS